MVICLSWDNADLGLLDYLADIAVPIHLVDGIHKYKLFSYDLVD